MSCIEWILYPGEDRTFRADDKVFVRTKSKKEIGRTGNIVDTVVADNDINKKAETKRADKSSQPSRRITVKIPISGKAKTRPGDQSTDVCDDELYFYTASFRPIRLVPVVDTSINKCAIIVTKATDKYRLLAASQLNTNDHVLEIGCSNGECSLVISKYIKPDEGSLIAFDVSQEMITKAEEKVPSSNSIHFYLVDPFTEPRKALLLATGMKTPCGTNDEKGNSSPEESVTNSKLRPSVVFIDIGGNRDLDSVIRMLAWVKDSFLPRLIIIKSEEMVENIKKADDDSTSTHTFNLSEPEKKRAKLSSISIHIEPSGRIKNGEEWFSTKLTELTSKSSLDENKSLPAPKFSHPKKAPLSLSPDDGKTPICRYYNYHKNGCRSSKCHYNHTYCHWCLQKGHTALHCMNPQNIL